MTNGNCGFKSAVSVLILLSIMALPAIAAPPQRIISAIPSITEMLYVLGVQDKIVGVTTNCNYPPEAAKKPKIGAFFINLETIASLKPDLVIMMEEAQAKDIEKVRRFGLPVYTLNVKTVDQIFEALIELGVVTGQPQKARQVVTGLRARIKAVEDRTRDYKPSVTDVLKVWGGERKQRQALVIVGLEPLVVAGGGSFIDDILRLAGVENVAKNAKVAYPQYSFEKLVRENPEYLIVPRQLFSADQLANNKRWQSLEAVKKNQILFIDQDILVRPGPRVVDAVEQIADFIY